MADVDLLFATQLYLDDIRYLQNGGSSGGDNVEVEDEDQALALQLQLGDLAAYLQVLEDAQLAQSIDSGSHEGLFAQGSSRAQVGARRPAVPQCAICFESVLAGDSTGINTLEVTGPCGHHLCNTCVTDLASKCIKDESLYPPRCCKTTLPIEEVIRRLPATLQRTFRVKVEEYEVPMKERIYCPQPKCSTFLGQKSKPGVPIASPSSPKSSPSFFSWLAVPSTPSPALPTITPKECYACRALVCPSCAEPFHPKTTCDANTTSMNKLMHLASVERWKRCPGCNTFIQKTFGCEHMVCRCKTEFCFTCGKAPWKSCRC